MEERVGGMIPPPAPAGAAEAEVIGRDTWGAIRALFEGGRKKKEIARELDLDVKTVRRHLNRSWAPQTRKPRGRLLDAYSVFIQGRAPEVGFNGEVLLRELRGLGYTGSYSALAAYMVPHRKAWRVPEVTVRFETEPGEQSQVDWGSTKVWLGQERERVHVFTMILGYSRRIFARAYLGEKLEHLLDGHERAFSHFGGRTETLLYDNPRTIVLRKDEASGQVEWNPTFKDRVDFYGFKARLCRYYRAQTKGKVESGVKYVKRNALVGKRFRDLAELNAYLLTWCVEVADQRIHGTTHERPAERFTREKLTAVDLRKPTPYERVVLRTVSPDAFVEVEANRYPVPFEWAGRRVTVRILCEALLVSREGEPSVKHARLEGKHGTAKWTGEKRQLKKNAVVGLPDGPPRFDPQLLERIGTVALRPLAQYEALAAGVSR
jgi:transposase